MSSSRRRRRLLGGSIAIGVALLGASLSAQPSVADDSGTLTVVGTSDVYDSNLVQQVLEPGFEDAYPQYDLNYVSKGTGAAIAYAEAGTASALIVHAASLENQFVADGYSNEKYGRAIFWGDYVLLGPNDDPVNVKGTHPHDIVGAFKRIAKAGATGDADFVSRGGTPGTTVQEHAIWSLATGVTKCTVRPEDGGGQSPSTTSGNCPAPPDAISYPAWYHATGLTQGPNITNADTCNYGNGQDCYVLTDRGTYQYLKSTGAAQGLQIVTRDNDASATGGPDLLVNSFHAYAVKPSSVADPSAINKTAATAFLNWITTPAAQTAVGNYLNGQDDPPFLPDAAPALSATAVPASSTGGKALTVTGRIRNVVPGTPGLSGITVKLRGAATATPLTPARDLASDKTSANGYFSLTYTPNVSRSYSVSVPGITKVENAQLDPVFGDLLTATGRSLGTSDLVGAPKISSITTKSGKVTFKGTLAPTVHGEDAVLSLYGVRSDAPSGTETSELATTSLSNGQRSFSVTYPLAKTSWRLKLRYANPDFIEPGFTSGHVVNLR